MQAFAQFGSDLDEDTKARLDRGARIVELFKQNQYSPISMELEVAILFAMQNGYFDDVPVESIKDCQAKLQEYLTTRKDAVLNDIRTKKAIDDNLDASLKQAIEDFKGSYKPIS